MSKELDMLFANLLSDDAVTELPNGQAMAELIERRKKRDAILSAKVSRHDLEITQMQKDIKELQARRLAPAPVEKDWKFWGEFVLYCLGGALIGVAVDTTVNYLTSEPTAE